MARSLLLMPPAAFRAAPKRLKASNRGSLNEIRYRLVVFAALATTASVKAAVNEIKMKAGLYQSENCDIEVYKQKSGNYYIELSTRASKRTTLRGDHMTITPSGKVIDGPGLCTDEPTLGKGAASRVVSQIKHLGEMSTLKISCGGTGKNYALTLNLAVNKEGELHAWAQETRAGFRKQSAECYDIEPVKN